MSDILPGLIQRDEQHAKVQADYAKFFRNEHQQQERLDRDRAHGRGLLESLRYKQYVQHRTLGLWLYTIGRGVRSKRGPWFWMFLGLMLWGYIRFSGWVL